MKKRLFALMLVAGGSAFAESHFSVGVAIGAPQYGSPAVAYAEPTACGPGYIWIDGYNDVNGYWVNGYCAVPPYSDAYWIAPRYFGGRFIAGYWGPGGGFRGGYNRSYEVRGGYRTEPRAERGYSNGFRSSDSRSTYRSQGSGHNDVRPQATPSNSSYSQGSSRGQGSATRGGGSGQGGRR